MKPQSRVNMMQISPNFLGRIELRGSIAEAFGGDGWDGELLPAGALLTGSEEYYPTVAINALMRSLRDAALSSQHFEVSLLVDDEFSRDLIHRRNVLQVFVDKYIVMP